ESGNSGLIVLRSLGKFFGMGGARVGFMAAHSDMLSRLREQLGPWTISGPSRWAAKQALKDSGWQIKQRSELISAGHRLGALLARVGLPPEGSTPFFQWCRHDRAQDIHAALCREGVLVRLFLEPLSIRFGLPANQGQYDRLEQALVKALTEI